MFLSRIRPEGGRADFPSRDVLDALYEGHRAIWRFFADSGDRKRDFLYRVHEDGERIFYTVSRRPPSPQPGWKAESKEYDPNIERGARLAFVLRANPAKRDGSDGVSRGKRHDIVMIEKRRLHEAGAEVATGAVVQEAGAAWLLERAPRSGFGIVDGQLRVDGYQQHRFLKGRGGEVTISSLDYEGILTVTDPQLFRATLLDGIGPAKGFGFGLMLVRRA